jgi:2-dehydropantoate 2-reductase
MLQDVRRGRRTEIDHLNGYVVREARSLGLAAPVNAAVVAAVHDLGTAVDQADPEAVASRLLAGV